LVDQAILKVIDNYLRTVYQTGIHVQQAILYGSDARGEATEWSDIDFVFIAPESDKPRRALINRLWELRAISDARNGPIACGVRQWQEDDGIPLLEIARRKGIPIPFELEPA
jgi:predicted nucleotidyltransferase